MKRHAYNSGQERDTRTSKRRNQMSYVTPYHLDRVVDKLFNSAVESDLRYVNTKYSQYSSADAYTIEVPLVGVTKEDLSIAVENNRLLVKAKGSVKSRFTSNFAQDWLLAEDADVSAINANLSNGLLTLTVPRVKPVQRTVNITVN